MVNLKERGEKRSNSRRLIRPGLSGIMSNGSIPHSNIHALKSPFKSALYFSLFLAAVALLGCFKFIREVSREPHLCFLTPQAAKMLIILCNTSFRMPHHALCFRPPKSAIPRHAFKVTGRTLDGKKRVPIEHFYHLYPKHAMDMPPVMRNNRSLSLQNIPGNRNILCCFLSNLTNFRAYTVVGRLESFWFVGLDVTAGIIGC